MAMRCSKAICFAATLAICILPGAVWSQTIQARVSPEGNKASADTAGSAVHSNKEMSEIGLSVNDTYLIGPGDVLGVTVWKEPDISNKTLPVRSDGKISLPLAGEIEASGKTPKTLEQDIATRLKAYISDPEVTVMVQEIKSRKFNILGQVTKPGAYLLTDSTTVLDAIAMAGGFRDFAKQKSIYVLRVKSDGTPEKLGFNYKEVIKGSYTARNIKLEPHDTVVVP